LLYFFPTTVLFKITIEIQLSLAIPPWVGAISTSESWDGNRHIAHRAMH